MAGTKRPVYELLVGSQKIINTHLSMNEAHWKPILMNTIQSGTSPLGVIFAVIVERVEAEDGV
jgi:hypothetical protein